MTETVLVKGNLRWQWAHWVAETLLWLPLRNRKYKRRVTVRKILLCCELQLFKFCY